MGVANKQSNLYKVLCNCDVIAIIVQGRMEPLAHYYSILWESYSLYPATSTLYIYHIFSDVGTI